MGWNDKQAAAELEAFELERSAFLTKARSSQCFAGSRGGLSFFPLFMHIQPQSAHQQFSVV